MTSESDMGRVIGGRYRLVAQLGRGGFGTTWKAQDEVLGRAIALKQVLLPRTGSATADSEVLSHFLHEASKAMRIGHPGLAAVYDVVVEGGTPWMVTELLEGEYLEQRLEEYGLLPAQHVESLAESLLNALAAAHEAGIVHGDIKPANVLLTTDGKGLLTDFDIGQVEPATQVTRLVVDAAEYMAPERVSGGDTDSAAGDLFSLGVTLYRAVEGISPFRRDHTFETLLAVRDEEAAPVRCAGALAPLITALLAKDPRDRPTAVEALAILRGTEAEAKAPGPRAMPESASASSQAMPGPASVSVRSNAALPLPGVPMLLVAVALVAGLGLLLVAGERLWRTGWGWAGLLGALWIVLTAHRVRAVLRGGAQVRQRQASDAEGAPDIGVRRARSFWEGITDVGFFSDVRSLVPERASRKEYLRVAYNNLGPPPEMPPVGPSLRLNGPRPPASGHDRGVGER